MSLPSGYKRLEYIQSSGTQWIDTGFNLKSDSKVVLDCNISYSSGSSWDMIFGAFDSSAWFSWWASGGYINAYYGSGFKKITAPSGRITLIADRNNWTANETTMTIDASTFTAPSTAYIFSINNGGSYTNASMKLYGCQIYDNDVLVRDFVPCITPSGAVGLYDIVREQFYGNAGTGTFTAGPVVDPYGNDKNTLLLLHGEDLTDSSPYGIAIANNGVSISNVQSKFGGKSMYFNGSSFLTLLNKALVPSSGDFTFDWWEYRTTVGSEGAIFHQNYGEKTGYGFLIGYILSGALDLFISSAGSSWDIASSISMGTILTNQWVHRAVVRNGSKFSIYQNGSLIYSFTSGKTITVNMYPTLGEYVHTANTYFSGYIDEFRISNVARWTEEFTPPSKPYSSSLNLPVNIGGTWKNANEAFVNIGGAWKTVEAAFVNIDGTWKELG